eukprot:TRINITY_DN5752_c0_g1_i3.p1 TRINITY_DN5752_c0_g1~~TRINITY_DN5752_c0_g1_i3.p1  ORF type:complete len:1134 (-),score=267.98 TRINITY_DN5752_c0_g1_i3:69-3470(-)
MCIRDRFEPNSGSLSSQSGPSSGSRAYGEAPPKSSRHAASSQMVLEDSFSSVNFRKHTFDDAARRVAEYGAEPFDLEQGPLYRFIVVSVDGDQHLFGACMHHIVTDGWSWDVFWRQLSKCYSFYLTAPPYTHPELPSNRLQYAHFAKWQQQSDTQAVLAQHLKFWQKELSAVSLPVLELPEDKPRPPSQSSKGKRLTFGISSEVASQIKTISQTAGATMFTTMLAAFQVLLCKSSRQDSVVVGIPYHGRESSDLDDVIGFFVNTLAFYSEIPWESSFQKFVKSAQPRMEQALMHGNVNFKDVVGVLKLPSDPSRNPIFQAMFLWVETREQHSLGNTPLVPCMVDNGTSKFDITMDMEVGRFGEIHGFFEYCTALYALESMQLMADHVVALLTSMGQHADSAISELSMMDREEEARVLQEWNGAQRYQEELPTLPTDTVHDLFAKQVQRTPKNQALKFDWQEMNYEEVHAAATGVAAALQAKGVGVGGFVPLLMDRSSEMLIGMLGILMAGAAYVPFAPYMPADRLTFMAEDCEARAVLTTENHATLAGSIGVEFVVCVGPDTTAGGQYTAPKMTQMDNMMCLYTSGSTGTPKAVALSHRAIVSHLWYLHTDYGYSALDKYLQSISFTFVASVPELFGVLMCGGCVVLAPKDALMDMEALGAYMESEKVTLAQFIPSVMSTFLELSKLSEDLRCVVLTGEALPGSLLGTLTSSYPEITFLNHYGCTEVTDTTTVSMFRGSAPKCKNVAVGVPVRYRVVLVLDNKMQPVPIGVPGELFAVGVGLATEYVKRPELTAKAFMRNVCGHDRAYATGDLVRWMHDGNMECLGRIDFQVKINGLRIELGEIEGALQKHAEVNEAAVLVQDKQLIAYVSPPPDDSNSVLEHCAGLLPNYMVPAALIGMAEWPRNANGKLDRKALPPYDRSMDPSADSGSEFVMPSSPTEVQLAQLLERILGLDPATVGSNHTLLQLGGQSLIAARVVAATRREMNASLAVYDLLKPDATLSQLAKKIQSGSNENSIAALPEIPRTNVVSPHQPAAASQEQLYMLWSLDPESAAYNENEAMHLRGGLDMNSLNLALCAVLGAQEAVRATFSMNLAGGVDQTIHPLPAAIYICLLYTSPSPRDRTRSRMPSSA